MPVIDADDEALLRKRVGGGIIHARLARTLGAVDLTLIGIGASIGSGIFVLSGVALKEAGPGVAFSFVVAAFVCMLDALCYAELAARWPVSGGAYVFTKKVQQRKPPPPKHARYGSCGADLFEAHKPSN
jgi:amino acid permease